MPKKTFKYFSKEVQIFLKFFGYFIEMLQFSQKIAKVFDNMLKISAKFLCQPQAGQELVRLWAPRYPAPRLPCPRDRETCSSQDSPHHQQEEYNAQYLY